MESLPSLPPPGPLLLLVLGASAAVLLLVAGFVLEFIAKRIWNAVLVAVPLVLLATSFALAWLGLQPFHEWASLGALVTGLYAAWKLKGMIRWLLSVAVFGLGIAIAVAMFMFGGA